MRALDLLGWRFGRLVVQKRVASLNQKSTWLCLCDCGNTHIVRAPQLVRGETRSCGCYQRETRGQHLLKHGEKHSKLYGVWSSAKGRCFNPTDPGYDRYGGRGITMCKAWCEDFAQFKADMGPRPPGHTLERINNNGHYEPGNCKWATRREQMLNTRRTKRFVHDGLNLTLGEWSKRTGLPESLLYFRIRTSHWPVAEALTTPSQRKKPK